MLKLFLALNDLYLLGGHPGNSQNILTQPSMLSQRYESKDAESFPRLNPRLAVQVNGAVFLLYAATNCSILAISCLTLENSHGEWLVL